jgi:primosomal protein N' (replication factor Y)
VGGARVCRVAPDVTAVERNFDYTVPEELAAQVRVGSIVRVPLHGRRVRGWVVADHVAPDIDARLLPIAAVVSQGPPPDVVALTEWIAWRWCGPRVAVLRSASPANTVRPATELASTSARNARSSTPVRMGVRRVPPLHDRRDLVAGMVATSGSTIVCVADGARARSLARTLAARGRSVAQLHSDEPAATRTDAWRRAAAGDCVVVGGRVAALAPVPDLAVAIVVDDADEALQEERVPTWHARDVLLERARRAGATWWVVSPAPTVEAEAVVGFEPESPPADVEAIGWPRVTVVDRREQPPGARVLTEPLAVALRDADGLGVCVLNRRGRFRLLACARCHELLRWDRPDERPLVCPACGHTRLRVVRAGVTRVREELEALLPGTRVVDVDRASDDAPIGADVVVGTEAVLHRLEVRRARPVLVAYLDLDQELLAPRYRAAAQALWLLVRGAQLLAGRPRHDTRLLLQTRLPEHEVVRAVVDGRPQIVTEGEIARRRALRYPPFGALAELTGGDAALARAAADLSSLEVRAFGPSEGRVLVQATDADVLAHALAAGLPAARALGRVRVAVDPPRV